jgi:hypothetical protein
MRAIVKTAVLWVVGLTLLLGLPAIGSAEPNFVAGKTYCGCTCVYSDSTGSGTGDLYWEKVGACSLANNRNCSYTNGSGTHRGRLTQCMECTANGIGGASCSVSSPLASMPGTISPGNATQGQPGTRLPVAPVAPLAPLR